MKMRIIKTSTSLKKQIPTSSLFKIGITATAFAFATARDASAITLADLNSGGSITVGDKLFDNWTVVVNSITGDDSALRSAFDLTNIEVAGDNSDPYNPTLTFTPSANEFTVTQDGAVAVSANLDFRFDVTVAGDLNLWQDHSLVATYTEVAVADPNNDHNVHAHSELYTDDTLGTQFGGVDTHLIDEDGIPIYVNESGVTETIFFTPRSSGTSLNELSWNTDNDTESVGITSYTLGFSQVPEPSSTALLGLGGLALMLRRRR